MIIKRKYELIGVLVDRDSESKKVFMDALLTKYPQEEAERILACESNACVYNADMSLCIPDFGTVKEKLEELDLKKPYDNGLTFRDVNNVVCFPSRQGKAAELWMIKDIADLPRRIVQIVAVEYDDGKTYTIKPWEDDTLVL